MLAMTVLMLKEDKKQRPHKISEDYGDFCCLLGAKTARRIESVLELGILEQGIMDNQVELTLRACAIGEDRAGNLTILHHVLLKLKKGVEDLHHWSEQKIDAKQETGQRRKTSAK